MPLPPAGTASHKGSGASSTKLPPTPPSGASKDDAIHAWRSLAAAGQPLGEAAEEAARVPGTAEAGGAGGWRWRGVQQLRQRRRRLPADDIAAMAVLAAGGGVQIWDNPLHVLPSMIQRPFVRGEPEGGGEGEAGGGGADGGGSSRRGDGFADLAAPGEEYSWPELLATMQAIRLSDGAEEAPMEE